MYAKRVSGNGCFNLNLSWAAPFCTGGIKRLIHGYTLLLSFPGVLLSHQDFHSSRWFRSFLHSFYSDFARASPAMLCLQLGARRLEPLHLHGTRYCYVFLYSPLFSFFLRTCFCECQVQDTKKSSSISITHKWPNISIY